MSNIWLEVAVTVRLGQWSNPTGKSEITIQVEADDASTLEFGTVLQGAIKVALSNLRTALQEEEKDDAD